MFTKICDCKYCTGLTITIVGPDNFLSSSGRTKVTFNTPHPRIIAQDNIPEPSKNWPLLTNTRRGGKCSKFMLAKCVPSFNLNDSSLFRLSWPSLNFPLKSCLTEANVTRPARHWISTSEQDTPGASTSPSMGTYTRRIPSHFPTTSMTPPSSLNLCWMVIPSRLQDYPQRCVLRHLQQ